MCYTVKIMSDPEKRELRIIPTPTDLHGFRLRGLPTELQGAEFSFIIPAITLRSSKA